MSVDLPFQEQFAQQGRRDDSSAAEHLVYTRGHQEEGHNLETRSQGIQEGWDAEPELGGAKLGPVLFGSSFKLFEVSETG